MAEGLSERAIAVMKSPPRRTGSRAWKMLRAETGVGKRVVAVTRAHNESVVPAFSWNLPGTSTDEACGHR